MLEIRLIRTGLAVLGSSTLNKPLPGHAGKAADDAED